MKPNSVFIELIYLCDNCGDKHYVKKQETRFPGGKLCYCGKELRFDPIKEIKVFPVYETSTTSATTRVASKKLQEKTNVKNSVDEQSAIEVVRSLGFKVVEFKILVQMGMVNNPVSTEELIKFSLENI